MEIHLTYLVLGVIFAFSTGQQVRTEDPTRCDLPRPSHNGVVEDRSTRTSQRIIYRCQYDFHLLGSSYALCRQGRWSHAPPLCFGRHCPTLPRIDHATTVYRNGRSIVRYECSRGYELRGNQILACTGRSRWNGTQPTCEVAGYLTATLTTTPKPSRHEMWLQQADYSCAGNGEGLRPPDVANATNRVKWVMLDGRPRLFAVYRCDWDFDLKPSEIDTVYCNERTWIGQIPTCVAMSIEEEANEEDDDDVEDVNYVMSLVDMSHEDMLERADYTCISQANPPSVSGSRYSIRFATRNGKPRLFAQFRCNRGLVMIGQPYLYCHLQSWVGITPICDIPGSNATLNTPKYWLTPPRRPPVPTRRATTTLPTTTTQPTTASTTLPTTQPTSTTTTVTMAAVKTTRKARGPSCRVNNGGCDHRCVQRKKNMRCRCRSGYRRIGVGGKQCEALSASPMVPHCSIDNGGCDQRCVMREGVAKCRCLHGFKLLSKHKTRCRDINECLGDNARCDHNCLNTHGSYVCSCNLGYALGSNRHSCREAHSTDNLPPHLSFGYKPWD